MGCCSNSSQDAVYDYEMQQRKISIKNVETLEKYGQGAAARNYTKNLKLEVIKEIAQIKKPCFKEGQSRPCDSNVDMIPEKLLKDIINQSEQQELIWNNYFEDIGEGRTYQGQWTKRGEKNQKQQWTGIGTIKYSDGAKYQGQTKDGKFNGLGRMTHSNGDIYQGQWKNGMAHGTGTFCDTQGSLYEGEWFEDQQHGKGTEYWDYYKIKYEGDFVKGKKSGKGKFECEGSTFTGDFEDGQFHGEGIYYFADSGKIYRGNFVHNKPHGKGEMTWPDQSKYVGEFENGMMQGQGEKKYQNGNIYNGQWAEDKPNGLGKMYYAKTKTNVEGIWENGKLEDKTNAKFRKVANDSGQKQFKDRFTGGQTAQYSVSGWK